MVESLLVARLLLRPLGAATFRGYEAPGLPVYTSPPCNYKLESFLRSVSPNKANRATRTLQPAHLTSVKLRGAELIIVSSC